MDYELTKRYFKVVDETINYKSYVFMMAIGIICLFLIAAVPVIGIIGICLIAFGIFLIVNRKKKIKAEKDSIPTDEQYDAEVVKKLEGLKDQALDKLGIDEDEVKEIEPISFDGYIYKGARQYKVGKDDLYRTNKYEAVMLFFSQHEVHCYTYRFDTTENKKTEETDVYFYKDIVSVSTASDEAKFGKESVNYEYFKLTTAGGTALTVSLRDVGNAQRSINAMRALLKEKKQG